MKRKATGIICIALVLGLFFAMALGSSSSTSESKKTDDTTKARDTTEAQDKTETTTAATTQAVIEIGKPINVGDYEVTVTDVILTKDYKDKPAITVMYDWTNNSDETKAPIYAVSFKVFQDGKELETAIITSDDLADPLGEVRPNISVEGLGRSFITTSQSELEIEISELISFGDPFLLVVPFPQG